MEFGPGRERSGNLRDSAGRDAGAAMAEFDVLSLTKEVGMTGIAFYAIFVMEKVSKTLSSLERVILDRYPPKGGFSSANPEQGANPSLG